jgi:MoaA/NifB/PqqE/SkfB family radical SAM enzyme
VSEQDLMEALAKAAEDPAVLPSVAPNFRYAKVKPTNNCNSRCITCNYWETDHKDELSLAEIDTALKALRKVGVEEVMFTGGEPTLRKDLGEMIAAASRLGFANIGVTTNSLSLNRRKIDEFLNAGLREIVLSLEGLTFHDEIRGVPGNTEKIRRHLEYFDEVRASGRYPGFQLKIGTTLMSGNLSDILGVVDLARKHKAVMFLNLIDGGTYFFRGLDRNLFTIEDWGAFNGLIDKLIEIKRVEPNLIGNSITSLEYARRYFKDPKQAQIPCYLGYVGVEVDANGDVFSNCWGLPAVGNIRLMPLDEILKGPAYVKRCQAMYRKECPGCSCGYILNLAYHPGSAAADQQAGSRRALGYAGERF